MYNILRIYTNFIIKLVYFHNTLGMRVQIKYIQNLNITYKRLLIVVC